MPDPSTPPVTLFILYGFFFVVAALVIVVLVKTLRKSPGGLDISDWEHFNLKDYWRKNRRKLLVPMALFIPALLVLVYLTEVKLHDTPNCFSAMDKARVFLVQKYGSESRIELVCELTEQESIFPPKESGFFVVRYTVDEKDGKIIARYKDWDSNKEYEFTED